MEQLSPAGLALVELAAAAGVNLGSCTHVVIDRERVTRGAAEERMAGLPKPVACTAIVEGGDLVISCRAPDVTQAFIMRERTAVIARGEGVAGEIAGLAPNEKVVVRGAGIESMATREAILRWITDYCSTNPSAVELRPLPDEPARHELMLLAP